MVDRVFEKNAAATVTAAPAAPSVGYPTAGNPSQGIPATRPGPYWYYMITESLRKVVADMGIVPDHTDQAQLFNALARMTARGVTSVAAADSPKALTLAEAGLVVVDASAGNVTLNLPSAAGNGGLRYEVMRIDAATGSTVTVAANGTDMINGGASITLTPGDRRILACDGTSQWRLPMDAASETTHGLVELATDAEAAAGTDTKRAVTPAGVKAAFAAGATPIGGYVEIQEDLVGTEAPPSDSYIKLQAGLTGAGQYNEGKLTSESVTGTAPYITATAVISDAGSPMNGETVHLLETEERFLRAGQAGRLQDDEFKSHTHGDVPLKSTDADRGGSSSLFSIDGVSSTAAAGGTETRPRNIGTAVYMRIK